MSRGIALAWLAAMGLLAWHSVRDFSKPPVPGRMLGASGVFALLALVAEYQPAAQAATLAAWGFDVAVLLQSPPHALTGGGGSKGTTSPAPGPGNGG